MSSNVFGKTSFDWEYNPLRECGVVYNDSFKCTALDNNSASFNTPYSQLWKYTC